MTRKAWIYQRGNQSPSIEEYRYYNGQNEKQWTNGQEMIGDTIEVIRIYK
jgi:hypothetical protein